MMRKLYAYILALFILFSLDAFSQKSSQGSKTSGFSGKNKISVTYLGGAAYLLESDQKKVMIDAVLTREGLKGFLKPSADTIASIAGSVSPFNNIDLFLVTHAHSDHFDAAMMDKCMQDNQKAKLLCPLEAVDEILKTNNNNFNSYKNRVIIPQIKDWDNFDTIVDGIQLKATKLPAWSYHPNGIFIFNIEIGDINILHLLGNTYPDSTYTANSFNSDKTDLLLVSNPYFDKTDILEKFLHFKIAVVHHIYSASSLPKALGKYSKKSEELKNRGFNTFVWQTAPETRIFSKSKGKFVINR